MFRNRWNLLIICMLFVHTAAANVQVEDKGLFFDAWAGAKQIAKKIVDSVREIKPFELQIGSLFVPVAGFGIDYQQQMLERRHQIKESRTKMVRERGELRPQSILSSKDMESELLRLISLGQLMDEPEEKQKMEFATAPETFEHPAPIKDSTAVVPGMRLIPGTASSSSPGPTQHQNEISQRLLSSNNDTDELSTVDRYAAAKEFREIFFNAKQNKYWPSRYRKIFKSIFEDSSTRLSKKLLDYFGPITKDTAYIPEDSKQEILEQVRNLWNSKRDVCLRACLRLASPQEKELTVEYLQTLKSENRYEPMEFDNGSTLHPAIKNLLDRLIGRGTQRTINYNSEKLVITIPFDVQNREEILHRFEPYEEFITLKFQRCVEHGACSSRTATNDFCSEFSARGYRTTIGAILKEQNKSELLCLTGYHQEGRKLPLDNVSALKILGSRAVSVFPQLDLLFLKSSSSSFNLVAFSSCLPSTDFQKLRKLKVVKIGRITGLTEATLVLDDQGNLMMGKQGSDDKQISCVYVRSPASHPFSLQGDCGSVVAFLDEEDGRYHPLGTIWKADIKTTTERQTSVYEREVLAQQTMVEHIDQVLLLSDCSKLKDYQWVNPNKELEDCLPNLEESLL